MVRGGYGQKINPCFNLTMMSFGLYEIRASSSFRIYSHRIPIDSLPFARFESSMKQVQAPTSWQAWSNPPRSASIGYRPVSASWGPGFDGRE